MQIIDRENHTSFVNEKGLTYKYSLKTQELVMVTKEKELVEKLGLSKNGYLNNAGKYLFSKNKPIKVKLAVFATDEQVTFIDQNLVSGNIYELIKIIQQYIEKHINWKSIISVGPRQEVPEVPREAIKEIVVNSLCHAKYNNNTTHEVSITPNAFLYIIREIFHMARALKIMLIKI